MCPTINLGKRKNPDKTIALKRHQDIYQDKRWKRVRAAKFRNNPLCEDCLHETPARVTQTEEVHHNIDIDTAPEMAFDYDNLVSLCIEHHKLRHRK